MVNIQLDKGFWIQYLIACAIVSVGAFVIHLKQYTPIQLGRFFMWLPITWFAVLVMCFIVGIIIYEKY